MRAGCEGIIVRGAKVKVTYKAGTLQLTGSVVDADLVAEDGNKGKQWLTVVIRYHVNWRLTQNVHQFVIA